ncbi:LysR family transcriptional regulator [Alteromonas sp. V450]|uniref:LysR family transcriptional regulator n=1 Tax=Alteromonas sp. V450 TaxID=1912139 RepID=UPI0008FF6242|nr:LysR family transcriptional regulator [Alteromonas sp. V450]OJF67577.1 LysR family transcriptional regulator [Alteromonas sp. V450]|tara:strand:+ start:651 stop:1565 length:915 start_codon:yes stop_codon:yes gene_type:complete
MNIEHLKLFVRIASTTNISLAGRELNISPAVASAHISKLEETLGVRLIHRTTRKVSLTDDGKLFLPHAQEVLDSIETAQAAVGSAAQTPQGTLRVTAPASFGRMHLIPALPEFLEQFPKLNIDFRFSDSILDVVEGGFDVAIRDAELKDSNLHAKKLADDRRIIVASKSYINKYGAPETPSDLKNHKVVNLTGLEVWEFKGSHGVTSVKTPNYLRMDNGEAVRDACIQGCGITLTATWCSYPHLESGELVQILQDYPLATDCALWAVYPSNRLLAPKVRAFIDFLAKRFSGTPYWDKKLCNILA